MKIFLIAVLIFFSSFAAAYSSDDDVACAFHFEYNGKKYSSEMPKNLLMKSAEFDLANPKLSIPLKKIVDIANTQLVKVTGAKDADGWDVTSISLNKWGQKEQKWYYAVSFETTNYISYAFITLVVTVDGQIGRVKQITEKDIE